MNAPSHAQPEAGPAILTAPVLRTLKTDRKSQVWLTELGGARYVIKRFGQHPVKQWITALVGRHPAQLERRRARRMSKAGLPVVPVLRTGWAGGRAWLVTPWAGDSLQVLGRAGRLRDPAMRSLVVPQLAALIAALIRTGWFFRDVRLSNLVLDADTVRLIDVGSARRGRSAALSRRMLAVLLRGMYTDGAGATNCARLLRLHFGGRLRDHRQAVRCTIELAHHV